MRLFSAHLYKSWKALCCSARLHPTGQSSILLHILFHTSVHFFCKHFHQHALVDCILSFVEGISSA